MQQPSAIDKAAGAKVSGILNHRAMIVAVLLTMLIFSIDLLLPMGIAGGVPYVVVIFLAARSAKLQHAIILTLVCSLLTIIGMAVSAPTNAAWVEPANRYLTLLVIWVTAVAALLRTRAEVQLRDLNANLEQRVQERTYELSATNSELEANVYDLRQAEQALRQSEKRLTAILDGAHDGIISVNEAGQITMFNAAAEKLFGYTYEEIIGRPLDALLPARLVETHREHINSFMVEAPGSARIMNERGSIVGLRKDGTEFPSEASISKIALNGEKVFTATLRDITERVEAEAALRESEETQRRLAQENAALAEMGRIMTLSLDIDEVYDAFAQEMKKLVDFDRTTVNTIDLEQRIFTVKYQYGIRVNERPIGTSVPIKGTTTEQVAYTKDIVVCQDMRASSFVGDADRVGAGLRSRIQVPLLVSGELIGSFALQSHRVGAYGPREQDILKRLANQIAPAVANARLYQQGQLAEEALRESETRFRDLVENTSDILWEMDPRCIYTYCSPNVSAIIGYTAEELMGRTPFEFMPAEESPRIEAKFRANFAQQRPFWLLEHRIHHSNGEVGVMECSGRPVFTGQGELKAFRGVSRDITIRKQAEEQLKQANETLEARVVERTQELESTNKLLWAEISERKRAEEELQRTRDDALKASQAKSEFLSTMSHEIRTPMNTIIGMAESLQHTQLSPKQQEYVRVFHRAGETLLDLINDILDLAKVEAGQIELEDVEFDLVQLVEDTVEFFSVRARQQGLELNCNVACDVPRYVVGDPMRLRQVISNLLSNAIKFTKEGRVLVQAERDYRPVGSNSVLFRISDSGVGISPDKQEIIFESFTQADASTTREHGGTGLGLSICKRLVELMNGEIWVESEVGQGSTFSFTAKFEAHPAIDQHDEPCSAEFHGTKALIVDDNVGLCLFLKELLGERGIVSVSVGSGSDALAELERSVNDGDEYQLLLLDHNLPDIDGLEVTTKLRKELGIKDLAIIMITASRDGADAVAYDAQLGISFCLTKPFKQSDVIQAIGATLGLTDVPQKPAEEKEPTVFRDQRPLRILLVDDYEDNWFVVRTHLDETPYSIDIAENGEVAVSKFMASKYDLVLMDVQMPVMDGYVATKKIRRWEGERGLDPTPIIALTANALKEDMNKSLNAGCTTHITKPIRRASLMEAIFECTTKVAA